MPYKLKHESVGEIANKICQTILYDTFATALKVDGEKLIALTNSRQVNSFLIRSLFNEWRKEVEKLESPYFDFKHEKVKDALKQFMNVLSNHISIDQSHLEPLLKLAIEDTVFISFAPKEYLERVLDRSDKPQDLKQQFKYIKTSREAFKNLFDRIDQFDTKASILTVYAEVNPSLFESTDVNAFLEKLNAGAYLETLFEKEAEPVVEKPVQEIAQTEVEKKPLTQESNEPATLNEQFQTKAQNMTLAEKLQKGMSKSIESGLTLNEKFMFQNALFGGDASKMKEALRQLDAATSLDDALSKANAFNHGWDMESEEIEAFMKVLEKRFG